MQSNSPQLFAFDDKLVRILLDKNGNFWWVAKDVAAALEYSEGSNPARLFSSVPDEWKGLNPIHTPGGMQEVITLSEQGLYFFIGRSDKPKALPYQKWLASEVLPALRKTGSYSMPSKGQLNEEPDEADYSDLLLDELPQDIKRMNPRARERYLSAAQQTARISGVTDAKSVHELFLNYCRVLGSGGAMPLLGSGAYTEASAADSVGRFVDACCQRAAPQQQMYLDILYTAYVSWCSMKDDPEHPVKRGLFACVLPKASPGTRVFRPREYEGHHMSRPFMVCSLYLKKTKAFM